jgi:pimeloyl-ACP methyl ester carboxylesterase
MWDAWYRVRCPVLLIRGDGSDVFPQSVANTMLDINPTSQLVEIAGAGHAPALMSKDEIGIVRTFLDASDAQPSASREEPPRARSGEARAKAA